MKHVQLMTQGQHLEVKRESGSHQAAERQQKRKQHGCHRETAYPSLFGKCNGANEYGLFSRHRVVLIPERAPNANAYAERFVRSIKEECLDRLIPIGERHFRRAVTEYVEHYHEERNHQGLDNRLISGPLAIKMTSRVRRRPRLGGLLNFYARAA